MILLIVLTLLFLALLLFPFLLANVSLEKDKALSLVVKSDNLRDPRYFSKAFIALMERGLASYDGSGVLQLSKKERLIEPPLPEGDTDALIYAQGDFAPKEARVFPKEIYCKGDAQLPAGTALRAIACLGSLTLGENCTLSRWADAERALTVLPGCSLGISVSSGHDLIVGLACSFRRLYAAEVIVGTAAAPHNPPEPPVCKEIHRDLQQLEDFASVEGSIVSMKDFVIGEDACVSGSVKSRGRIHVKRGAHIMGNLIADADIVVEDSVFVGGIVFSQRWIYLGPGTQVGRKGHIKSVVAKCGVTLAEGVREFG